MALTKVLKFSATWCGPCKVYKPIFEKTAKDEKYSSITFEALDVETCDEELIGKYGIKSVPTTILLNENDEVLKKIIGSVSEHDLVSVLNDEISK